MLYLLISEGTTPDRRAPVFATADPAIIAAVGTMIARKLGANSPVVRKLRGQPSDGDAKEPS
jgi:hypothetical protein